jgi:16S rRNA (guanine1207-N2)-methyltransferase
MGPQAAEGQNHYFDSQPGVPSDRGSVQLVLPDRTFELITDSGVFSGGGVDAGTKYLLLEDAQPPPAAANLLDLGCGYGPIALTLAARAPRATVWAIDVNQRALELTRENAAAASLENVRVGLPGDVPAQVEFDAIVSNPPIRIGKQALHEVLTLWLDRLRTGATATLVVQKHLGSDSLQRWLTEQGWPTDRLGSRAGYRLLNVRSA